MDMLAHLTRSVVFVFSSIIMLHVIKIKEITLPSESDDVNCRLLGYAMTWGGHSPNHQALNEIKDGGARVPPHASLTRRSEFAAKANAFLLPSLSEGREAFDGSL